MADSDNTTTPPLVTRREILAGTAIAGVCAKRKVVGSNEVVASPSADPAMAVWRRWQDAHSLTERLCRQQQYLERKLLGAVGFPGAKVRLRDGDRLAAHPLQASDDLPEFDPQSVQQRANAEAEFAAHQARWDAADKEIGYSATLYAEREAGEQAQNLLIALSETPATSLAGVLAKLDAVLSEGQPAEDSVGPRWPLIRSALEDLVRISQQIDPK